MSCKKAYSFGAYTLKSAIWLTVLWTVVLGVDVYTFLLDTSSTSRAFWTGFAALGLLNHLFWLAVVATQHKLDHKKS